MPVSKTKVKHDDLVVLAAKKLISRAWGNYPVVLTEMATGCSETPDAIGIGPYDSTLIECKTSHSDFLVDQNKTFRVMPKRGMGTYRYYLCPPGVIKKSELRNGWGLIWTTPKSSRTIKPAAKQEEKNERGERRLLLSGLRRLGFAAPEGMSIKCYTTKTRCRTGMYLGEDGPEEAVASTGETEAPQFPRQNQGGLGVRGTKTIVVDIIERVDFNPMRDATWHVALPERVLETFRGKSVPVFEEFDYRRPPVGTAVVTYKAGRGCGAILELLLDYKPGCVYPALSFTIKRDKNDQVVSAEVQCVGLCRTGNVDSRIEPLVIE